MSREIRECIAYRADYNGETVHVATLTPEPPKRGRGWYCSQGYIMRRVVGHPHATKRGYVLEHRLIMERVMGRILVPRKELVHHLDENRSNNVFSNLELISPIEHPRGHVGERNPNGRFIANDPIFQEIKFRLLNKNTKECRPYTLCELIGKTYRKGQFEFRGRFTGLRDDSDKAQELYQDDICTADYDCPVSFDNNPHKLTGTIEWDKEQGMWMFDYGHGEMPLCCEDLGNIFCIGNVHENPELLCSA